MRVLEWSLKIIAAGLISYIVIGLFKTLSFYLISYYCWVRGGKLELVEKHTSIEYDENDKDIAGTEREEEIIFKSWYECITFEVRQSLIEKFEKDMSISMARNITETKFAKSIILITQFITDTLSWPRFTTNLKFTVRS